MEVQPNPGKHILIDVNHETYARYPVRTHVITREDNLLDICFRYTDDKLQGADLLFISERIVAITQGRAFPISAITAGWLAKTL
ncbi:MAG TPA: hypothetical protein VGD31_11105, partial [Sphingobacteriaceae bacterium]